MPASYLRRWSANDASAGNLRASQNALINNLSGLVQLLRQLFLGPAFCLPRLLDGNSEVVADLGHCNQ